MSTASILNDLITVSKDGEQGFLKVAEEITEEKLKIAFEDRSKACASAAAELQALVAKLGEEPTDSGSVLGSLHRGWIDIKSAITGRSTYDILAECEKGEDAAKAAYEKALETELPEDIRAVIERQYDAVQENHDMVRNLRDEYDEDE